MYTPPVAAVDFIITLPVSVVVAIRKPPSCTYFNTFNTYPLIVFSIPNLYKTLWVLAGPPNVKPINFNFLVITGNPQGFIFQLIKKPFVRVIFFSMISYSTPWKL